MTESSPPSKEEENLSSSSSLLVLPQLSSSSSSSSKSSTSPPSSKGLMKTVCFPPPSMASLMSFTLSVVLTWSQDPLLGLIDAAAVGRFGGPTQLAALGLASQLTGGAISALTFLSIGTTNLLAREASYNKENKNMKKNKKEEKTTTTTTSSVGPCPFDKRYNSLTNLSTTTIPSTGKIPCPSLRSSSSCPPLTATMTKTTTTTTTCTTFSSTTSSSTCHPFTHVMKNSLWLSAIVGLCMMLLMWTGGIKLLTALTDPSSSPVLPFAAHYIHVRAIGIPFELTLAAAEAALLVQQRSGEVLGATVLGSVLNLAGDAIFPVLLPPSYATAIVGIAWSSNLSSMCTCLCLLFCVVRGQPSLSSQPTGQPQMDHHDKEDNGKTRLCIGNLNGKRKTSIISHFSGDLVDVFWRIPARWELEPFFAFAGPCLTQYAGKIVFYAVAMSYLATLFGPLCLAAHHVILNFYFAFCPASDAISLAAQTFLPAFLEVEVEEDNESGDVKDTCVVVVESSSRSETEKVKNKSVRTPATPCSSACSPPPSVASSSSWLIANEEGEAEECLLIHSACASPCISPCISASPLFSPSMCRSTAVLHHEYHCTTQYRLLQLACVMGVGCAICAYASCTYTLHVFTTNTKIQYTIRSLIRLLSLAALLLPVVGACEGILLAMRDLSTLAMIYTVLLSVVALGTLTFKDVIIRMGDIGLVWKIIVFYQVVRLFLFLFRALWQTKRRSWHVQQTKRRIKDRR